MNSKLITHLKNYFQEKPEIIAVYLFGSQAAAKSGRSSDVDVGILLDTVDKTLEIEKKSQYMLELANILRKEIHPVILNSAGEELMRQIFAKGKCLLVKDQKKLALFKMTMFARIADYDYYRSQLQAGLIRNIVEG
jgi:predicted nucleotidyltransferase